MSEEDGMARSRIVLEDEMARKEAELAALEELSMEAGFAPRRSLARSPPLQPRSEDTAASGMKRLLTSPEEVQEAVRRRVHDRRSGMPPVGGILTRKSTKESTGRVTEQLQAPPPAAEHIDAAVDPFIRATKEELLAGALAATKGIMESAGSKTSKLNKDDIAAIGMHTERLASIVGVLVHNLGRAELEAERAKTAQITGELTAMREELRALREDTRGGTALVASVPSYSTALKLGKAAAPVPIKSAPGHVLAFYPTEESAATLQTSEHTKAALQKAVNPQTLQVRIEQVRRVGNCGVVVKTATQEEAKKLREAAPPTLRVTEPQRRQPLLAVRFLDESTTEEDLLEAIHELAERNGGAEEWTLTKLKGSAKLLFKRGRQSRTTLVLQTSPKLREFLLSRGSVYVGWQVATVCDYVNVTCCNKCQLYGHPEKYCREKGYTCGKCGDGGHKTAECQAQQQCCATCKKFGRKEAASHSTASRDCPARAHAEARVMDATIYN